MYWSLDFVSWPENYSTLSLLAGTLRASPHLANMVDFVTLIIFRYIS